MAVEDWQQIQSLFTDNGNGTYTVKLYDVSIGYWRNFLVSSQLNRGNNAAELSGDTDDLGAVEIWTVLLEKAYGEMIGWDDLSNGGHVHTVWTALTGRTATLVDPESSDGLIYQQIINALLAGKQVAIGTLATIDGSVKSSIAAEYKNVFGKKGKIWERHAYYVEKVDYAPKKSSGPVYLYLKNPHDFNKGINVNIDFLTETIGGIYILD